MGEKIEKGLTDYYKEFRERLKKHKFATFVYFRSEKIFLYSCKKCKEEIRLNMDYDNENYLNRSNIKEHLKCRCGSRKFKKVGERIL